MEREILCRRIKKGVADAIHLLLENANQNLWSFILIMHLLILGKWRCWGEIPLRHIIHRTINPRSGGQVQRCSFSAPFTSSHCWMIWSSWWGSWSAAVRLWKCELEAREDRVRVEESLGQTTDRVYDVFINLCLVSVSHWHSLYFIRPPPSLTHFARASLELIRKWTRQRKEELKKFACEPRDTLRMMCLVNSLASRRRRRLLNITRRWW